jgi:hypothetical protein
VLTQAFLSVSLPSQNWLPPNVLQVRVLLFSPGPQVLEQGPNDDHSPHSGSRNFGGLKF